MIRRPHAAHWRWRWLSSWVALGATSAAASFAMAAPAAPATTPVPAATPARATSGGGITESLQCSACHSTVAWKNKSAEPDETGGFDHSSTGFPLTGQHMGVACVSCHVAGQTVKRDCVSCHQDRHAGRLSRSCDQCHSAAGWKLTRPIEIHQSTRLPLTGMHVLADCTQCHTRAAEHQWSGTPADCFACHERDYRRPNLRPIHQGSSTSAPFPRDCSLCHRSSAWIPATFNAPAPTATAAAALAGAVGAPPGHDLRFPITFGVHRLASCSDCHVSAATPRNIRCIGCHAHDPVRLGQQHRRPTPTQGAACVSCHLGGARR